MSGDGKASYFIKPRTPTSLEENKLWAQQGACLQLRSLVNSQSCEPGGEVHPKESDGISLSKEI